ncbi:MAG: TetR/AcrR family transcriptional regulator [Synergistaceae bacterium]|nr:TetR/AcrR family transcriptional regulator [Synergistaceae bacterium]
MRRQDGETSKKILDAARGLIAEKGYANVSMRDVAREAGVALSQINYHYKSKDGLFIALIREVKEALLGDIRAKVGAIATAEERVDFLSEYAKKMIVENPDIHRLHIDFANLAIWSEDFRCEYDALTKDIAAIIAEYLKDGSGREGDKDEATPEELADMLVAVKLGVSTQYLACNKKAKALKSIDLIKKLLK